MNDSFLSVFEVIADFFIYYCNIMLDFGGIKFTVGTMFIWCGIALLAITAFKRLS